MENNLSFQLLWIISGIGALTIIGVFTKMKPGFGPMNLRAIGIVLLATFSSIIAIANTEALTAGVGILGAIAGYLFGSKDEKPTDNSSKVGIEGSSIGDNAEIAGRDINKNIENLKASVAEIKDTVINQYPAIQHNLEDLASDKIEEREFLINTIYERGPEIKPAIEKVMNRWASEGWKFLTLSSDYQGMDGIILIFSRPSNEKRQVARMKENYIHYHHGSRFKEV